MASGKTLLLATVVVGDSKVLPVQNFYSSSIPFLLLGFFQQTSTRLSKNAVPYMEQGFFLGNSVWSQHELLSAISSYKPDDSSSLV